MPAKRFEYAASLDPQGRILAEDGDPIELTDSWLPEHLVLAALVRCTLESLRYYARGATVSGSANASGTVTQRDTDGLFALVEVEAAFDVAIDPSPEELAQLLGRAERGCFVGNSLSAKPRYVWRVNGEPAAAA